MRYALKSVIDLFLTVVMDACIILAGVWRHHIVGTNLVPENSRFFACCNCYRIVFGLLSKWGTNSNRPVRMITCLRKVIAL